MSLNMSIHDATRVTMERVTATRGDGCWTTLQVYTKTFNGHEERMEIVLFSHGAERFVEFEVLPARGDAPDNPELGL